MESAEPPADWNGINRTNYSRPTGMEPTKRIHQPPVANPAGTPIKANPSYNPMATQSLATARRRDANPHPDNPHRRESNAHAQAPPRTAAPATGPHPDCTERRRLYHVRFINQGKR